MRGQLGDSRWGAVRGVLWLLIASGCAHTTPALDEQGPRALPLDAWRKGWNFEDASALSFRSP
jgi:hypothetical protein